MFLASAPPPPPALQGAKLFRGSGSRTAPGRPPCFQQREPLQSLPHAVSTEHCNLFLANASLTPLHGYMAHVNFRNAHDLSRDATGFRSRVPQSLGLQSHPHRPAIVIPAVHHVGRIKAYGSRHLRVDGVSGAVVQFQDAVPANGTAPLALWLATLLVAAAYVMRRLVFRGGAVVWPLRGGQPPSAWGSWDRGDVRPWPSPPTALACPTVDRTSDCVAPASPGIWGTAWSPGVFGTCPRYPLVAVTGQALQSHTRLQSHMDHTAALHQEDGGAPPGETTAQVLIDACNLHLWPLLRLAVPGTTSQTPGSARPRQLTGQRVYEQLQALDPHLDMHFVYDGLVARKKYAGQRRVLAANVRVTYTMAGETADDYMVQLLKSASDHAPTPGSKCNAVLLDDADAAQTLQALAELATGPKQWLKVVIKRPMAGQRHDAVAETALREIGLIKNKHMDFGLTTRPGRLRRAASRVRELETRLGVGVARFTLRASPVLVVTDDVSLGGRCFYTGALICPTKAFQMWLPLDAQEKPQGSHP